MLSKHALYDCFATQSSWQDRYRQLILLAKQVDDFPESLKTPENQIFGCENRVWLAYQKLPDQTFVFQAESEGRIVKGLLAILLIISNGKTAQQIANLDYMKILQDLHIASELSQSRLQGLTNIIERIRSIISSHS